MKRIRIVVVIALGIAMFVTLATVTGYNSENAVLQAQLVVSVLSRVVGLFLATVSALLIVWNALERANSETILIPGVSLLAGLAIIDQQWPTVLMLGFTLMFLGMHPLISQRCSPVAEPGAVATCESSPARIDDE